jgi:hypothetical protein
MHVGSGKGLAMTAHKPTKAEAAAATEAKAKHALDVDIKARIAAEKAANPHLAPATEGSLIAMLEGKADDTSTTMDEIHLRLAQMRAFIDQAILEAEGDLKTVLQNLRAFLF